MWLLKTRPNSQSFNWAYKFLQANFLEQKILHLNTQNFSSSLLDFGHEILILNLQVIGIAESLVRSDPCSTNCFIHLRFNIWKLSWSPGPQLETSDWFRVITWPGYWPLIGPQPGATTWDWVRQSFGSDLSQKFCVRGRVCWEGRLVSEESLHVCYKIIKC